MTALPDMRYGKTISLDQLPDLAQFQRVSVAVKALRLDDPIQLTSGKRKQDVIVSDSTGSIRLTLWEDEIEKNNS